MVRPSVCNRIWRCVMRVLKCCLLIAMMFCLLCSCTSGGDDLKADGENIFIIESSPTNETLTELSSQTYSNAELLNISRFNGTFEELNGKYGAECVRKTSDGYRVSFLGESSFAIIYCDESGNIKMGEVYSAERHQADFMDLLIGQALNDVQGIDPNGSYLFLYTGRNDPRISTHCTIDGYIIHIKYDEKNTIVDISKELL